MLGAQFVQLWLDNARKGWTVAYSPGPHDATTARAAIRNTLAARLEPAVVDYLDRLLLLVPTRYSLAELEATRAGLGQVVSTERRFSSYGMGCALSDSVRIEVSVGEPGDARAASARRVPAGTVRRHGRGPVRHRLRRPGGPRRRGRAAADDPAAAA